MKMGQDKVTDPRLTLIFQFKPVRKRPCANKEIIGMVPESAYDTYNQPIQPNITKTGEPERSNVPDDVSVRVHTSSWACAARGNLRRGYSH
jgi:hypothetical protein